MHSLNRQAPLALIFVKIQAHRLLVIEDDYIALEDVGAAGNIYSVRCGVSAGLRDFFVSFDCVCFVLAIIIHKPEADGDDCTIGAVLADDIDFMYNSTHFYILKILKYCSKIQNKHSNLV